MNVVILTTEFPSSAWRRAFAEALIRLLPDLNPDVADEMSDSAYLRLADLDPGHAAALYNPGDIVVSAPVSDRYHIATN